jgi:hypothetical protein
MYGSGVVAQHVYYTLRARAPIQAALGNPPRLKAIGVLPEGTALPAALHYAEQGTYGGTINSSEPPNQETLRYVVRFICQGESDGPIRAAAKDALLALSVEAHDADIVQDGETFHVSLLASNEWTITTTVENGVIYRQLGFYLDAFVTAL